MTNLGLSAFGLSLGVIYIILKRVTCSLEDCCRFSKTMRDSCANSPKRHQNGHLTDIWGHPRCHEREAEASIPWHRGFRGPSMARLDRPTARTHRAATG